MSTDDEAGFRVLFDEHLADLWRFARRRVGTPADADDIAADTFAVAWRRRDDLPTGPDLRLWLFGVARNVLANHLRGETRRRRLHLRLVAAQGPAEPVVEPPVSHAGPSLAAALASLGDGEREVLLMRYWDGLAVHEIATLLGSTPNAVSLRLHKARRRLAEKDPARAGQVADDPLAPKDPRHA
jgi:RNA polymerase sigma-70 factor (ECF subfamily)